MSFFFFFPVRNILKSIIFFFQEALWGRSRWILRKCLALIGLHFGCEVLMGSVHTHHPALLLSAAELPGKTHVKGALETFQPKVRSLKELRCQGCNQSPNYQAERTTILCQLWEALTSDGPCGPVARAVSSNVLGLLFCLTLLLMVLRLDPRLLSLLTNLL